MNISTVTGQGKTGINVSINTQEMIVFAEAQEQAERMAERLRRLNSLQDRSAFFEGNLRELQRTLRQYSRLTLKLSDNVLGTSKAYKEIYGEHEQL